MTNINSNELNKRAEVANMNPTGGNKYVPQNDRSAAPEYYTTIEDGVHKKHYYAEEEMNERLEGLDRKEPYMVKQFKKLDKFEPMGAFRSFKEEAEEIINEVQSLEGELYTQEGKNAEIRKRLKKLADDKKNEALETEQSFSERSNSIYEDADKKLRKRLALSPEQVAEANLRNSELEGQIRGKLYTMKDTRTLEFEFQKLAEDAKKDKGLFRFLENNYYLFLDKINQLDTSEMDKERAMHRIQVMTGQLVESKRTDTEHGLLAIKDNLSKKTFNTRGARRQIDNHLKNYLNKY